MVPTEGRPAVELMMAVWSPGFYRVEDYARKVEGVSARTPDGMALEVESTRKNRWRIANKGGATEGRRVLPAHLRSPVGHDELGGPRPDRPERRGRVRHDRRARRPPPPARGPARAPARMPAVGDRDGCGPRRPPGPLPGPGLRHAGRFADRRRRPVDPRVRGGGEPAHPGGCRRGRRVGRRPGGAQPGEDGPRDPAVLGLPPLRALRLPQRLRPRGRRAGAQGLDPADRGQRRAGGASRRRRGGCRSSATSIFTRST